MRVIIVIFFYMLVAFYSKDSIFRCFISLFMFCRWLLEKVTVLSTSNQVSLVLHEYLLSLHEIFVLNGGGTDKAFKRRTEVIGGVQQKLIHF